MNLNYPLQTIGLNAPEDTEIESNRFVITGDNCTVTFATGSTKPILGVSGDVKTSAGNACDIHTAGIVPVEYGGTVTKDAPLTSDAEGRAVVATTNGAHIAGFATESGALGDVGGVDLQKGYFVATV